MNGTFYAKYPLITFRMSSEEVMIVITEGSTTTTVVMPSLDSTISDLKKEYLNNRGLADSADVKFVHGGKDLLFFDNKKTLRTMGIRHNSTLQARLLVFGALEGDDGPRKPTALH
jgi:hypothetical protein